MRQVNEFRMNQTFCIGFGYFKDLKLIEAHVIEVYGDAKKTSIIAMAYDAKTERYTVRLMNRTTLELADVEYVVKLGRACELHFRPICPGLSSAKDEAPPLEG